MDNFKKLKERLLFIVGFSTIASFVFIGVSLSESAVIKSIWLSTLCSTIICFMPLIITLAVKWVLEKYESSITFNTKNMEETFTGYPISTSLSEVELKILSLENEKKQLELQLDYFKKECKLSALTFARDTFEIGKVEMLDEAEKIYQWIIKDLK